MTTRIDWPVTSDAEMVDALALFSPFKAWMSDAHTPRTATPVKFIWIERYVSYFCEHEGGFYRSYVR
jgi:hypothetical protein